MPSLLHEGLLEIVRDQPELAATILKDLLDIPVPAFTQARMAEAELPELVPIEYRADAVVLFVTSKPVFGVIVEAQLQPDPRKRFTWPVYAAAARARHECPFVVIVATPDPDTARWAAPPIELGPGSFYRVYVLGPEGAPIITDVERACREPYLAMLSVMAHGQGDPETALAIAGAAAEAIRTLPRSDQRLLYWYILRRSLGEAARKAFEMLPNIQPFLNESERTAFAEAKAEGKAEGKVEGEAAGLLKILARRGLEMTDGERARILSTRDLSLLDRWYEVALSIASVRELFELEAVQPPH